MGFGVTYAGLSFSGAISGGLCSSGKTLTIGLLTDLTDGLTSQGVRAKEASTLAVSDINSFLSAGKCNLKFAVAVDDYQLDKTKALTDLQNLAASGVQVVVGPLNSGAALNILTYANSNHIVLISPSSTSVALAIANDYLFRTAPNDYYQGKADARMLNVTGAKAVITLHLHDPYGDGLANATETNFKNLTGKVIADIPYDPMATDFTSQITDLYNNYQTANATYPNKVAIYAVSFEEFGTIMYQVNQQHPSLLGGKLPWYGDDGEAQDTVISGNVTTGPLVSKVVLPSTVYGFLNNTKSAALESAFIAANPGNVCDNYCRGTYDDMWLAALSTLSAGSYDGTKIQAILPTVATNYYGVTGWCGLDQYGDRVASTYQIWKVVKVGSTPTWVYAASWDASTDIITPSTFV